MENQIRATKCYIYGRYTHGKAKIEALEDPKGLTWWSGVESASSDGEMDNHEIFFALEPVSADIEATEGLKFLGERSFPKFYMSEEVNGNYYTYVTDDPNGPGELLFPVSWIMARINLVENIEDHKIYALTSIETVQKFDNPSFKILGSYTKEMALKYGGIARPGDDPKNSAIAQSYLRKLDGLTRLDDFEGPLDLLLHFVKESKRYINEINLVVIIKEYLNYINQLKSMNINLANEYLTMESELNHLRNKLNQTEEESDEGFELNSEADLRNKLIEYQKNKNQVPENAVEPSPEDSEELRVAGL